MSVFFSKRGPGNVNICEQPAPEIILPRPAVQAYAMLQPEQQGINLRQILT